MLSFGKWQGWPNGTNFPTRGDLGRLDDRRAAIHR